MAKTWLDEAREKFEQEYEKPVMEPLIVGFSGIDPCKKSTGGGGGSAEAGDATDAEYDEMLKHLGLI